MQHTEREILVKPLIICAPDGYIVDIYGLYSATWNDARILKHILETHFRSRQAFSR